MTAEQLYQAEGGSVSLILQGAVVLLGVGSVFATSARIRAGWTAGNLNRYEWGSLSGAVLASHWFAHQAGVSFFGNRAAYNNHWAAYGFVKSQNRWQGRQILAKAPMMY